MCCFCVPDPVRKPALGLFYNSSPAQVLPFIHFIPVTSFPQALPMKGKEDPVSPGSSPHYESQPQHNRTSAERWVSQA